MQRVAIFTAIDGTLLHARTFDAGAARDALQRLRERGIPVVPVTVMPLDEIAPIAAELGLHHTMIIEGGSAIARWRGGAWELEQCGPSADAMLDVIRTIEERSGANLLVYSALPPSLAAHLSGRSGEMLEASMHRRFSEPFVIENGELADVAHAAAEIGFSVRRGRRFLHLCRDGDERKACARVREELRCELAIGAGGTIVDVELLEQSEVAIVVPNGEGGVDAELMARLPNARVAPAPAPEGWAAAVEEAVALVLPRTHVCLGDSDAQPRCSSR